MMATGTVIVGIEAEVPAAPPTERIFEFNRYREGRLMAEGARVRAANETVAIAKAKSLFHPWDPRDTLEACSEVRAEATAPTCDELENKRATSPEGQ